MIERKLSSHWRNKSANLSVNLDLISARISLRSPLTSFAEDTPDSQYSQPSPVVHLSPIPPGLKREIDPGEIRPVSPNRMYLLRQGII